MATRELDPSGLRDLGQHLKMNQIIEDAGLSYDRINGKLYRPTAKFTSEERTMLRAALRKIVRKIESYI